MKDSRSSLASWQLILSSVGSQETGFTISSKYFEKQREELIGGWVVRVWGNKPVCRLIGSI